MESYGEVAEDSGEPVDEVFRKLMYFSYPLEAAGGLKVFHKLLHEDAKVVDDFFNLTDARLMQRNLDGRLGISELSTRLRSGVFNSDALVAAQVVLTDEHSKAGARGFATLLFYETGVELRWTSQKGPECMSVRIPEWDEEYFDDVMQAYGPDGCFGYVVSKRDWYFTCWYHLAIALLVLAGVVVSNDWSAPVRRSSFATFDERMFAEANQVHGRRDLGDVVGKLSNRYPTTKELLAKLRKE